MTQKTEHHTSHITFSYVIALSLIALLSISAYVLVQSTLRKQISDAPLINLSGRQRMLSQKLSKEALLLSVSKGNEQREIYLDLLKETANQWTTTHSGLKNRSKGLEFSFENSEEVIHLFSEMEPYVQNIKDTIEKIESLHSLQLEALSPSSSQILEIVHASSQYLTLMDRAVSQYSKEAQLRVAQLVRRESFILTSVLLLLTVEALFIFRPMASRIRKSYADFIYAREELRIQATFDSLTDTLNHGAILESMEKELSRARREKKPFCTMMIDLDHFKQVNDTYGHLTGDRVLKELSQRIGASVRPYDRIGRYGGDEFLVILSGCSRDEAQAVGERIHTTIGDWEAQMGEAPLRATVSIGIVALERIREEDLHHILQTTDKALYEAKKRGRNCTVLLTL